MKRYRINLPERLLTRMQAHIEQGRYRNLSVMIRQACWELVERLERGPEPQKEPDEEDSNGPPNPGPTLHDLMEVYKWLQQEVPG